MMLVALGLTGLAPPQLPVIAVIDLAKPFDTRSAWSFFAIQGQQVPDSDYPGELIPGIIRLCLSRTLQACSVLLDPMPKAPSSEVADLWEPHYLYEAKVVYPRGSSAAPLLLLVTGGAQGPNGNQIISTQLLAYRPGTDRFEKAFGNVTGRNNNEETRLVSSGPLKGDVISAEATEIAPYGYWITVSQLTPAYSYKQILRYRSATHYNDNNPLAVIDSEMPNIESRLGIWRPGQPLQLPDGKCPKPRLVRMELWCG